MCVKKTDSMNKNFDRVFRCYRCNDILNDINSSAEHVILNACGGKLKSKRLLCKRCNSVFGNRFDKELANTTSSIATMLMIKREKGQPQYIYSKRISTGEEYYIDNNFSPFPVKAKSKYEISNVGDKSTLHIEAKDHKELKKLIKGLKRKYPSLDENEILNSVSIKNYYISEPFEVKTSVGGTGAFRSLAKSAISFFIMNGGSIIYINHLITYLEGIEDMDVAWFYYPEEEVYSPDKNEVSHVLKVVGDPREKVLYAYVELFNLHCFIVKLNEHYDGIEMDEEYIFNVHTHEEKRGNRVAFKLSRAELLSVFKSKATNIKKLEERYARILCIANKIQVKHELRKIISYSFDCTINRLPVGTIIDEEIINSFMSEFTKRLAPFIAHMFIQRR